MRDRVTYNAPIVAYQYDGRKCYYRYEDMNFSIFNNELSTEEVEKLRSTIDMLSRYRGIPSHAWLEEVISNLEYRFGVKANSENVVAFEQNEQLKELEFLSDLIDAAVAHKPLMIHYRTYAGKEKESVLHPYHVKQYVIKDVGKTMEKDKNLLEQSKLADESTDLYRDPDETEDIWNDQSLDLQERITAAATRLANNHRDNKTLRNDAMRAIGGNLADLRKPMSLQRTFDMTTVKRVADLARVMMNNGYLNGLTQQEVKRLLAAVKHSVGRNDIDGDVQKVMDIMVDNQLKHAEDALH